MKESSKIYDPTYISACYFRSTADSDHKKVILQITERCNMFCKHCFVSSTSKGNDVSYCDLEKIILPKLLKGNVSKVTLTGGEPLLHKEIKNIISLLVKNDISVSICTNGLLIDDQLIEMCCNLGNIHFNISLDGFRFESHGTFRGIKNESVFHTIINNIREVGKAGLLNGILVTPNIYASTDEYSKLCSFAKTIGAKYVLFNPLSEFGRGQDTQPIGYHDEKLLEIQNLTQRYIDHNFEVVYIRFPEISKDIGGCPLGEILYIFTNGDIAICPYVVFAAYDRISLYKPDQFFIANIFDESCDINEDVEKYELPTEGLISIDCVYSGECSRGCIAAKVSSGRRVNDCDFELCNQKGKL